MHRMAFICFRGLRYRELQLCDQDERDYWRKMWIRLLDDEKVCLHQLRVTGQAFKKLCDVLVQKGGLVATRYVTIKEILALFLHILAHDLKNSTIRSIFAHPSETISRQFHIVLRAMMKIGKFYIKQNSVSLHEVDDKWKWFKGALGALDGTLIEITVPASEQGKYRDRKGNLSTNVLGACDANLKFTYVLPGWEGSASDSCVLRDALTRCTSLKVPQNMYYLVDLGYTNGQGFLAPYRGTRYHLNLWRGDTPTNYKELFNLRHSAVRNTIERGFGLIKKRWAIVHHACFYDVKTQIRIINACFTLHNFIRDEMVEEDLLREVDEELEEATLENEVERDNITFVGVTDEWSQFRDNLAMEMFEEYQAWRALRI
ncbi:hypothetical protein SLA2020_209050 [Shorea laevis]